MKVIVDNSVDNFVDNCGIRPVNEDERVLLDGVSSAPAAKNWAREFSKGLVTPAQLVSHGLVEASGEKALAAVKDVFDIRVPQAFLGEQRSAHPALARQVVPGVEELVFLPEELEDPIGDEAHTPVEGVTHRYPDRALLKVTYQCAAYCRFCFRRYKVSDTSQNLTPEKLAAALNYIEKTPSIFEVILTGGDPLTLTDGRLAEIFAGLARIPHVGTVRIHTRIPTVLPERVTLELLALLRGCGKPVWLVAHINAAAEFTPAADVALARLVDGGIPVLAQSVLLAGVNATEEDLMALLKGLIVRRVKPYYLHYPDLARGTGHFRVPPSRAVTLMEGLRGRLPGTALPQLIVDIPGGFGKVPLEFPWACRIPTAENGETWVYRSPINGQEVTVKYPQT